MKPRSTDAPLTVGRVLFDDDDPASDRALKLSLEHAGVYGAACQAVSVLSAVGRDEIRSRLTEAAQDLLGARVVDMVVAGWRKQGELARAGEATAGNPEKTVLVDLYSQRITANDECTVTVIIDGWPVPPFRFVVTLIFDIKTIFAVVQGGRLVKLRGGNCDIQAILAVNDQQVAAHRRQIELNRVIPLGDGIPLCRSAGIPADV